MDVLAVWLGVDIWMGLVEWMLLKPGEEDVDGLQFVEFVRMADAQIKKDV